MSLPYLVGMSHERHQGEQPLKALGMLFISGCTFSIMGALVKHISTDFHFMEIVFFRSFLNFLMVLAALKWLKLEIFPTGRKILVLRGIAGFTGISLYFFALGKIPLSIVGMLGQLSPLFVILFGRILLGESLNRNFYMFSFLALVGSLLLLLKGDAFEVQWPLVPVLACVVASMASGVAHAMVRAASGNFPITQILLYFSGIAAILSFPFLFVNFRVPELRHWAWFTLIAGLSWIAQYALTRAFVFAKASTVGTLNLMTPIFSILWGYLFFDESLASNQWFGGLLILMSLAMVVRFGGERRIESQKSLLPPK